MIIIKYLISLITKKKIHNKRIKLFLEVIQFCKGGKILSNYLWKNKIKLKIFRSKNKKNVIKQKNVLAINC